MFTWEQTTGGVHRALTGREGGVSRGAWLGLNLGLHVEDDPDAVRENRSRLAAAVGAPVVYMDQCHGAEVAVVDTVPEVAPSADALVTTSAELAVAVLVADCVPVLLASPDGVVAAVHAGRPGLVAGVVDAALDAMRDLGASAVDAVVGPSVCGRCYEVPAAMRDDVAGVAPLAATVSWTGTTAVDVAAGVVARLTARDVPVTWVPGCTRERDDLYSYRRDRTTGRFAGVVRRVAS
ncbi:laccase domain-containing protein [Phycicoccus sp. CSK15P-2]|uniref:polyphenol oxidase family protein n=1 Tax=Phycicoccus sp. CSK15P-2 TaxID=2807627 RepID=UPI00194DECC7|nr:polyphenol oxidase family protein [Phycicoccus sp. CSK15P-2]MBM6404113.1 laccase domain-containing protein [Phycicoccus sp. CSK15P-2]